MPNVKLKTTLNMARHYLDTPSFMAQLPSRFINLKFPKLSKRPGAKVENNSLIVVSEDSNYHTRCHIFNYWSGNYRLDKIDLECSLYSKEGKLIKEWGITLTPNMTGLVEFKDIVPKELLPFVGLFTFRIVDEHLYPDTMGKFVVETYNDDFVSSVHEQGCFTPYRKTDAYNFVQVVSDENYETDVLIPNCLNSLPFNSKPISIIQIQLINETGQHSELITKQIPYRGVFNEKISELFPDAKQFLGGKKGVLQIYSDNYSRPMIRILKKDGSTVIWHSDSDKSKPIRMLSKQEKESMGDGPVAHMPAIEDNTFRSKVVIYSSLPFNQPHAIDFVLYSADGKKVFEKNNFMTLVPNKTYEIPIRELLKETDLPFHGHARITFSTDGKDYYPREGLTVHTNFSIGDKEGIVNLGSYYSNPPQKPTGRYGALEFSYNTSKIYARIWANHNYKSYLFLVNSSTQRDYTTSSQTKIMLISGDGMKTLEKDVVIPPNGVLFSSIPDLFPEAKEFLASCNGLGAMLIKDRQVKLTGVYVVQNLKTNAFATDHFMGG